MKPETLTKYSYIGIGFAMVCAILYSCTKTPEIITKEVPVYITDSTKIVNYEREINKLNRDLATKKKVVAYANDSILILNNKIDSLYKVNANLKDELLTAKYKIERVKYYNDVAKKGNNIKYLRGWIIRALKD